MSFPIAAANKVLKISLVALSGKSGSGCGEKRLRKIGMARKHAETRAVA